VLFRSSVEFLVFPTRFVIEGPSLLASVLISDLWLILYREPNCCEFVTLDARPFLLHFTVEKKRAITRMFRQLKTDELPFIQAERGAVVVQHLGLTAEWISGALPTTDYLLRLNFFGGRSYSAPALYPIFPLVAKNRRFDAALCVRPEEWLAAFAHFPAPARGPTVAELLAQDRLELTPEFFTMPEALAGVDKPYEFVYQLRRRLESEEVSAALHLWIDRIFGILSPLPKKIFRAAHPARGAAQRTEPFPAVVQFEIGHGIASYAAIESITGTQVAVYTIVNKAQLWKTVTDLADPRRPEDVFSREIAANQRAIAAIGGGLLLIDSEKYEFEFVSPSGSTEFQQEILPVEFCEENGVCFSTNGEVFCLEKKGGSFEIFGICKISPEIPVCAFSETRYSLTLVGVRSGRVMVFDRKTGRYLRTIGAKGPSPKRVLLTATFPFVIVHGSNSLTVISVYGELLRTAEIGFEISAWCPFVASDGFDFVVMSDTVGQVFLMEAFLLTPVCVFKCGSRILAMKYGRDLQGVVGITQEGRGVFLTQKRR
jgi:hypothetical protein